MAEQVFLNNRLVDIEKASISISDSGFLYGAGLFETMRSYNGAVFELDKHLERLFNSVSALSISNTYSKEYITDAVYQTIKANQLTEARLRLTLTSGSMSSSQEQPQSTLLVAATKLQPYPAEYYQKGVLVVLNPFRQNAHDPACGHKTTSYFSRMLALNLAHQKKSAEALWFTVDNRLAEGCVSNVFLVKDSVLYTPSVETPVLPGVMRKTVCDLACENSIPLLEKDLSIDDVLEADEIFLTNVIMQIMPVNSVEKHNIGEGKVGPVTKKLRECFDEFIKQKYGQSE
jgi:branched-chain amino acid aminotransferase